MIIRKMWRTAKTAVWYSRRNSQQSFVLIYFLMSQSKASI